MAQIHVPDPLFEYLRFWPEELYKLSVTCNKAEVLGVYPGVVLL